MKTVRFNPIGELSKFTGLINCIETIVDTAKDGDFDTSSLKNYVDKSTEKIKKSYEEILDYISQFWGKYINIKFYYNSNYGETRESKPDWKVFYEANVMPYRYVPENHCLFGLYCKLNDKYRGGVEDKSIDLFNLVQNDMIEITEITKEDFLNDAKETLNECLNARCNKIESNRYELTKYGYERRIDKGVEIKYVLK